ncbi:RBBP9/YdeN family alpha/beta hydrolase [Nocardia africana]|uniref:Predicted esterase of the alpha/beta hydrolase fold n=1 Tax=Nocardia africana TaxID=134964 RepID=A0A378WZB5_9NOCA|nr:alpha/beta hydrolase [Nocardia africana]MCC3312919.1 alpha/beta hydrolase [Nocardia africana]SUA45741.1 Predicted esterase of the alpha/beta hydrolase fold [Nocardia africana]
MQHTLAPVLVIVPGLGDHGDNHWHNQLAATIPGTRTVRRPSGDALLNRDAWVTALDNTLREIPHPVVLVAHSAGVLTTVHWACRPTRDIHAALLVTPPDFEHPLPDGYPSTDQLTAHGWNPIPGRQLGFPSILATSSNDPLATRRRVAGLAETWGSRLVDLGPVGHLDPTAGYGPWPRAQHLLDELTTTADK